ncbi:4429_t:CDS:2, partial [Funneliformis mosseae]
DDIVDELENYTIYNALLNAAEAWSMVSPQTISNCWIKQVNNEIEETPENYDTDMMDEDEFIPILEKVSLIEAENAADKIIRFLYEQEPEFGEVNEELEIHKDYKSE